MSKHSEIPCLTSLRGIAALWVMFFHLDVAIFYRDLGPLIPHESTGLLQKGYLWVDFFFILSGFIVTHVYGNDFKSSPSIKVFTLYIWARFSRIYPLHLFTLGVAIIGSFIAVKLYPQVVDGSWQTYFDWNAIPSQLLLTNAMNQHTYLSWNIASWSIGAEWWTYFLAIPVIYLTLKKPIHFNFALAISSSILLFLLAKHYGKGKLDITFDYGFFRCFFEFCIGVFIYRFYTNRRAILWIASDATVIGIIVVILGIFHWQLNDILIIPAFCLLILACSANHSLASRFLNHPAFQYLGKISYSIYLVHSLWFLVYWNVFPHFSWPTQSGSLPLSIKTLYVFSFTVLTLASSHLTYHFVEVPSRSTLRSKSKLFNKYFRGP